MSRSPSGEMTASGAAFACTRTLSFSTSNGLITTGALSCAKEGAAVTVNMAAVARKDRLCLLMENLRGSLPFEELGIGFGAQPAKVNRCRDQAHARDCADPQFG